MNLPPFVQKLLSTCERRDRESLLSTLSTINWMEDGRLTSVAWGKFCGLHDKLSVSVLDASGPERDRKVFLRRLATLMGEIDRELESTGEPALTDGERRVFSILAHHLGSADSMKE